jgi:hypothetical protein
MKKLILQINGGLGNQLFQFHAGYLYSEIHDCDLYLDFSRSINDQAIRRRKNLGMDLRGLHEFKLPKGTVIKSGLISRFFLSNKFLNLFGSGSMTNFIDFSKRGEIGEKLKINDFEASRPGRALTRLKGNFQSLEIISAAIELGSISELELRKQSSSLKDALDLLELGDSLAIHVRLTDYLKDATSNLLSSNYYGSAFEEANLGKDFKHVWMFSDDIELAKSILPQTIVGKVTNFVSEKDFSDAESLLLMSKFDSLIISNSTFSYFSAFYGKSGMTVFAPNIWFMDDQMEIKLEYPHDWIEITI